MSVAHNVSDPSIITFVTGQTSQQYSSQITEEKAASEEVQGGTIIPKLGEKLIWQEQVGRWLPLVGELHPGPVSHHW
jgi:hypothetical protein